jgi:3-deoxy-7-phosphoheptulonate synthase
MDWAPDSWQKYEARQQPAYPDAAALAAAQRELAAYPPLVTPADTDALKASLAEAQAGRAFFALIAEMGAVLEAASGLPVVRVTRMAGQFAKPRSTDEERKDGIALPSYRGDIVNAIAFDAAGRAPDPERMFRAYVQATATLAHLKRLSADADTPIYSSHEALLLPYEQALARPDPGSTACYGSSGHFLWVGDRTRFPGSAHVEFLRGLANPIGIKCGPSLDPDTLLRLLDLLDPRREPGRITLISRMGCDKVEAALAPLLRAVKREGRPALWTCDPMHGNTIKAASGYKTRPMASILAELARFFAVTRAEGVRPGGIHIEMTGQNVTECTGGEPEVSEQDLGDRYHTHCDPRLNAAQAREVASLVAAMLGEHRHGAVAA